MSSRRIEAGEPWEHLVPLRRLSTWSAYASIDRSRSRHREAFPFGDIHPRQHRNQNPATKKITKDRIASR